MTSDDRKKLEVYLHDIKSTLSAMENVMNGAIAHPEKKDKYQGLFVLGKKRIMSIARSILKECSLMDSSRKDSDLNVKTN